LAADSRGTKNEPQYAETGASDDAADLTEIAAYAAKVGNRRVDTNAVRNSLTGADLWNGLEFLETDTGLTYLYSNGWQFYNSLVTTAQITTFGTNWSPVVGAGFTPTVTRIGARVYLEGAVKLGASGSGGYTNILTIPAAFQPPTTANRFVGNAINSVGVAMELVLVAGVLQDASGYVIGSPGFSVNLPLHCSWTLN